MGNAPIRLLVIEDDEADFALLLATLNRQSVLASCRRVDNQHDMAAALATGEFDAVISDHQLPGFSSSDALSTLQASGQLLPFIIVSGTLDEEEAAESMKAGADDFVSKGKLARLGAALTRGLADAQTRRERTEAQQSLQASETRLRALSAYLQSAIENERKAIAREIHDDVGGMLTALRFDLDWLLRHAQDDATTQRAQQALDTVSQAMLASQRISRNLRPPVLEAGVVAAIEWQVNQFRKRTGIHATFSSNVERAMLDDGRAIAIYRCVQEALTNIVKHAKASTISVDLVIRDAMLSIEVTDDGKGLDSTDLNKPTSFGLRGLSERARAVNGWLDVLPGRAGTTILLTIPLGDESTIDIASNEESRS